jgi:hypothetical protein
MHSRLRSTHVIAAQPPLNRLARHGHDKRNDELHPSGA